MITQYETLTFATIFSFVLLLAFARAVEAFAVLRAVVGTHELAAVVLPVFRSASAEALVTFAVVRAVILAQSCTSRKYAKTVKQRKP